MTYYQINGYSVNVYRDASFFYCVDIVDNGNIVASFGSFMTPSGGRAAAHHFITKNLPDKSFKSEHTDAIWLVLCCVCMAALMGFSLGGVFYSVHYPWLLAVVSFLSAIMLGYCMRKLFKTFYFRLK